MSLTWRQVRCPQASWTGEASFTWQEIYRTFLYHLECRCSPCTFVNTLVQAEEAVESAVKEFEAQGVDLSGIIKTATGGDIGRWAG